MLMASEKNNISIFKRKSIFLNMYDYGRKKIRHMQENL